MAETQAETLERFFRALTDAMRDARGPGDPRPLTVGEIYQDLVPYRLARSAVGFAMNADYEHALMRLLAGEGEYLRLDPEEARRELERELSSTNPDVTLYRKFATCGVRVAGVEGNGDVEHAGGVDPARDVGHAAEAPAEPAPQDPGGAGRRDPGAPTPEAVREPPTRALEEPPPLDASPRCRACDEPLPSGRTVRFCPYCGEDRRAPCAECGEILEPGWRFCTVCGRRSGSGA